MKAIVRLLAFSLVAAIAGFVGMPTADARSGTTVAGGNGPGSAANQLNFPAGVAVDSDGNLYVADGDNARVQTWGPAATTGVTVAGGNDPGSAPNQLDVPAGMTLDSSGNLYVADAFNDRVQRWAPGATTGVTVAGGNGPGSAPDQLEFPLDVAVDPSGNVYVADSENQRVQKWAPGATTGVTVAGGNSFGSAPNQLEDPNGVALDGSGNVYVADTWNHRVQRWAPGATTGVTVAGGNGGGSDPDQLSVPSGVTLDSNGNLFVADWGNGRVQRWAPGVTSGVTVANELVTPYKVALDGDLNLYVSEHSEHRVQRVAADHAILPGQASMAEGYAGTRLLEVPISLASPFTDTITVEWTTMQLAGDRPDQADPTTDYTPASGTVTFEPGEIDETVAITINGDLLVEPDEYIVVSFHDPTNATIDGSDGLGWITNDDQSGSAVTIAGGNGPGPAADQLNAPYSTAMDGDGDLYVADGANHRVQKWAPGATSGVTVAGGNGAGPAANQLNFPTGVAVDGDGNVYVAEALGDRVQKWAPGASNGVTVAGGNGEGSDANQFNGAYGVALDDDGNLYVADLDNARVQKWAPGAASGVTVAGGNGEGSEANQLWEPDGVAVDSSGNLYVAEHSNQRVQKWAQGATSGVTVAGGNGAGPAADQLDNPQGMAIDGSGNVYVADHYNDRVQKWAPGAISGVTVAGGNDRGFAADQLNLPAGVTVDSSGNVYVADGANHRVQLWPADHRILPGDGSVTEGDSGTTNLQVPVSLSTPSSQTVTVQWTTVDLPGDRPDQADPGTDYTPMSGTVTFNPGETTKTAAIVVNGDTLVEPDEYVIVSFHDPTNATMGGAGLGTGFITNDDFVVTAGVGSTVEANAATILEVPVNLSGLSTEVVTVQWTTVPVPGDRPDQADPTTDYTPMSGTVTFDPGETTKTAAIVVNGDTLVEPDEYVIVSFHDPTNASMGGFWGLGIGFITNDDHALVTPGVGSTVEANAATILEVPVTLSNPSTKVITVQWTTVPVPGDRPDQADPTTDYTPTSGTVTFDPGETTKTVTITINGDILVEPDEYIIVAFHDPTNATMGGFWGLGIGFITNDD